MAQKGIKGAMIRAILMIAIVVCLMSILLKDTYMETLQQIQKLSFKGIVMMSLMECCYLVLDSMTISVMIRQYQPRYTYREGLRVLLYGNFYKGITFGSGTKLSQIYMLHKQTIPIGVSSGILTMQYTFHRIGVLVNATFLMVFFPVFELFDFGFYKPYFIAGYVINMGMITVTVLLCTWQDFHKFILKWLSRILRKVKKEKYYSECRKCLVEIERESRRLLRHPRCCLKVLMINCLKLMFWYGLPFVICVSMEGTVYGASLIEVMTLAAIMELLLGVIPTPVGMGSTEVVYFILFSHLFGQTMTNSSMLVYRLFTYYVPFSVSIFYMIATRVGKKEVGKSERENRSRERKNVS